MTSKRQSQDELRVCVRTFNFGTIVFFLLMVIILPVLLVMTNNIDILKYYFPFLVLLASMLTTAGEPNNFQDLYPQFPTTVVGAVSSNMINFVALLGILWAVMALTLEKNSVELGVSVGLITIIITFPVATQLIPYFIRQGDIFIKNIAPKVGYRTTIHKYVLGGLMILFIISLQILLVGLLTNNL